MRSPEPGHAQSGYFPTSHSKAISCSASLPVATLSSCSGSTITSITTSATACVDGKSPPWSPCMSITVPLTATGSESMVCPFTMGAHSGLMSVSMSRIDGWRPVV